MQPGLLSLPWWGCVIVTLSLTHITIVSVTVFLHRHQAHRALDLHPIVSHFFRFWLWLTTGMTTKNWVAIHRKHHAKCETVDDPHSPQIYGIRTVLFQGAELYRKEGKNAETLEKYGHYTPDDWLERHIYKTHEKAGIGIMLIIDVVLFGPIGLTMWAVQMLWIPFLAAGVINGIGHYLGYRNFASNDASANVIPWGILIGGEELHNNHHAYTTSARLSNKWWEFDIGWMYIRILEMLGLAKVRKLAPKVRFDSQKTGCDEETLRAILMHRYDVLTKFAQYTKKITITEVSKLRIDTTADGKPSLLIIFTRLLQRDAVELSDEERVTLNQALTSSELLNTIYSMRQELAALWSRSTLSKEQLLKQLQDWCQHAEDSGVLSLQAFSRKLRSYV
ncbi:MAG: fatty acid desaturase [Pseudomonadota bacterium]